MGILFFIIAIAILLMLHAFYAGAEMGIVSVNQIRLRYLAEQGSKNAQRVLEMLEKPERLLGTTLVGVNLATVASSSLASYAISMYFARGSEFIATAVMLPLVIIFGELVPKVLFRKNAERLTLLSINMIRLSYYCLLPVVAICSGIGNSLAKMFRVTDYEESPFVTREELRLMVKESAGKEGPSRQQFEMAHQAFYFGETLARHIMVPLIHVSAVPVETTVAEIRTFIEETGYSHIPVYEDRIDHIVGVLEMIDIIDAEQTSMAGELMREPVIVPEMVPVDELLDRLRSSRANLAILLDEYGGVSGIATTEDIMEEIVGEMRDEYDETEPSEVVMEKKALVVDGKVTIDRLNEDHGLGLPKESVETIAGLVISLLGRIPRTGEKVVFQNYEIEVLQASPRMVRRVRIKRL